MTRILFVAAVVVLLTSCGEATDQPAPIDEAATLAALDAEPITPENEPLSAAQQAAANADINLAALAAYRDHAEQVKADTGTYPMTKRSFRLATGAFEDAAEAAAAEGEEIDLGLPDGAEMKSPGRIVYKSDGADYKLIAQRTGDCSVVREKDPGLIDPKRSYGPGDCIAYGYWTSAAETW